MLGSAVQVRPLLPNDEKGLESDLQPFFVAASRLLRNMPERQATSLKLQHEEMPCQFHFFAPRCEWQ